ncbi:ABC transporter substrate-binding protein [Thiotrichales bacterium 19S3-7]|nr:ABC transporter substrate-binding protein [Thiotrichales bacterium 19S3-7]MCF6801749.1 ABC transporter substrate-binding protein [Thiotrichales bacterium 19S3-11]
MMRSNFSTKISQFAVMLLLMVASFSGYAATTLANKKTSPSAIDHAPKRVVVLNPNLLDDVILLGIKPVGYAGNIPDYMKANLKSVAYVGSSDDPSSWDIFYLSPDLIIGSDTYDKTLYLKLQKMAPTMLLDAQGGINSQIENLKILGITFKKQKKAKAAIEHFRLLLKQAETLGQAYPATTLMLSVENNQLLAVSSDTFASKLLKRLGKDNIIQSKQAKAKSNHETLINISLDEIQAKDPDQIILLLKNGDISSSKSLLDNPKWKALKAVKYHHVYYMDYDVWLGIHSLQAIATALTQAKKTGFLAFEKFVML